MPVRSLQCHKDQQRLLDVQGFQLRDLHKPAELRGIRKGM